MAVQEFTVSVRCNPEFEGRSVVVNAPIRNKGESVQSASVSLGTVDISGNLATVTFSDDFIERCTRKYIVRGWIELPCECCTEEEIVEITKEQMETMDYESFECREFPNFNPTETAEILTMPEPVYVRFDMIWTPDSDSSNVTYSQLISKV